MDLLSLRFFGAIKHRNYKELISTVSAQGNYDLNPESFNFEPTALAIDLYHHSFEKSFLRVHLSVFYWLFILNVSVFIGCKPAIIGS